MDNTCWKNKVASNKRSTKRVMHIVSRVLRKIYYGVELTQMRNDLNQPETTYSEQEITWNDLQRPTTSKTQPTMIWTYVQQAKKDAKRPTTSIFWDYFTIWGKMFSSLTRFSPNIWLQSFEHCFTENLGENRAPSVYYHLSSVNYHVYFLRDIRRIFFCLSFVSAGKGRGYYFGSSLPLSPVLQIVRSSMLAFIREV